MEPIPMRTYAPQQPESPKRASAQNGSRVLVFGGLDPSARRRGALFSARAGLIAAQLFFGIACAAQMQNTPAPAPPATHAAAQPVAHSTAHARTRKKPSAAKPVAQAAPAPAPVAPAAPPMPNWPVNDKPAEASVIWDSHGLLIVASNSSLDRILSEISLKIGAKVEGAGEDERVFGSYGPGPARDVLSELLEGTGYNVLMVGDQGEGTPRRIVLSGRPAKAAPPSGFRPPAGNDNDSENDLEPEPNPAVQMPPPEGGGAPPMPVRTPQQMMEERQRQLQQLQQQQQQNNPGNPQN
jgi:hypothetical protein